MRIHVFARIYEEGKRYFFKGEGLEMTNDIVDFDKRLTNAMEERGISQADLCRLTGLASSMVSHYCTGQRMPSIAAALKIAKALGTTVSFLAYGEMRKSTSAGGDMQVAEAGASYDNEKPLIRNNDDKEDLIDRICLLNLEGQKKVLAYIEDLLATGKYK